MLRAVLSLTLLLVSASFAAGQEPNPEKSSQPPWPLDQRCAIMAAHPGNQGALTSACIASPTTVPILSQPAVPARSLEPVAVPAQPSRSHSGGAGRED